MLDLKPFYDAARAANDKMQGILNEMSTAFNEGSEEGKQKALDLRPDLDQAKIEADEANQLYLSIRDAAGAADSAAKMFVPTGGVGKTAEGGAAKEMTRAAFEALTPDARMLFIKGGGKLVDPAAE